jgi:hypothetical protein
MSADRYQCFTVAITKFLPMSLSTLETMMKFEEERKRHLGTADEKSEEPGLLSGSGTIVQFLVAFMLTLL